MGQQLKDIGLEEYKDFCIFERFALEWNLRWKNKCVLSKIDTVITTRCTLKCKNCNMFISHMTDQHDLDLSELKKNFDTFFESVDYVYEYTLLGGEPFLHKNIKEILTYMGERYGTRIGKINLISNGTVVPAEEVLEVMEKYQVMVNISDYTHVVPYEDKLNKVERVFESHGIEYYVIPNNTWKDVLYPSCEYHTDNPKEHMRLCGHGTHSVDGGKLYWCDPAFSAERFLGFAAREDDSLDLDLNQNNHSKFDASLNIIKYILGDVNERGYMTICTKCAGVGWDNDNIVTAGIQK
jgi:organic radical activating enzyme